MAFTLLFSVTNLLQDISEIIVINSYSFKLPNCEQTHKYDGKNSQQNVVNSSFSFWKL